MLSYMSYYSKLFSQYLLVSRKILEKYNDIVLGEYEILAYETIIYNSITNRNFREKKDMFLATKWIVSDKSFIKIMIFFILKKIENIIISYLN